MKLTAEEVARGIVQREQGEVIKYGVIDPSATAWDGGPSIAERINQIVKPGFHNADNKRVAGKGAMGGWDQLRARLKGDGSDPMLFFFSTCADTIRTLPALQHDELHPEDVDSEGEDHAGDETRYGCMSRPYVRAVKVEKPPEWHRMAVNGVIVSRMPSVDELNRKVRQAEEI